MRRLLCSALLGGVVACTQAPEESAVRTDLDDLLRTGTQYRDFRTTEPFYGPVFSTFGPDDQRLRMRGQLVDGLLEGDAELFSPQGLEVWIDVRYERGRECGVWRLNPFASLVVDSLFWVAEVESRVPVPFSIRDAMSIEPSWRSPDAQAAVAAYYGNAHADSLLEWSEGSPQVSGTILYRTDNTECFDAAQTVGNRWWNPDPYGR